MGAFFPPISLENDGIGWTSRWTLTPSAINSWVGEELRTIGAELRVEHRGDAGTFSAQAALFGRNDPAGELLAARGWSMGDLTSGLGAVLRNPCLRAVAFARSERPAVRRDRPPPRLVRRPDWVPPLRPAPLATPTAPTHRYVHYAGTRCSPGPPDSGSCWAHASATWVIAQLMEFRPRSHRCLLLLDTASMPLLCRLDRGVATVGSLDLFTAQFPCDQLPPVSMATPAVALNGPGEHLACR